jgi:ATP/maltotriose-dependent transcriptional regulator MalT
LEIQKFLDTFTGSLRPIQEYLLNEVFVAQTDYIQEFLLRTSVLSRLSASLCDEVTGRDDSSVLLDQLDRDNLFLIPLDASGQCIAFTLCFPNRCSSMLCTALGKRNCTSFAARRVYGMKSMVCSRKLWKLLSLPLIMLARQS